MKLLIIGTEKGSYRYPNYIKYFKKKGFQFFENQHQKKSYINRFLSFPKRIIDIFRSESAIVMPMNLGYLTIFEVLLCKLLNKVVIVDFYSSNYEKALQNNSSHFLEIALSRLRERIIIALGDKLIFLNNSEANYFLNVLNMKIDDPKILIVPLCVDDKKIKTKKRFLDSNSFVNICWWGSLLDIHGIDNILSSLEHLNSHKIRLNIFGNSDEKSMVLLEKYKDYIESNRLYISNELSFSDGTLNNYIIEKCDLSLGMFGDLTKSKTVLPNKVIDSLAMGIPCLTYKTDAIKELLGTQSNYLYFCENTPSGIADGIKSFIKEGNSLYCVENAIETFEDKFSFRAFERNLDKIFF